jgi:hypothetical protein
VGADVLSDGDLGTRGRRRSGLRLAHGPGQKHPERSKAASEEAGPAQQSAAIKTSLG